MKIYKVTGYTKKGGDFEWSISVVADNAKDAKAIAKSLWYLDAHLFGIKAKKAGGMEYFFWAKTAYLAGTWPDVHWVNL